MLDNKDFLTASNLKDMPFKTNTAQADDPSASIWVGYPKVRRNLEGYLLDTNKDEIGLNSLLLLNGDFGTGKSHALMWARYQLLFGNLKDEYKASCYYIRSLRSGIKYDFYRNFKNDVWTAGLRDETLQYKQWLGNQIIKYREDNGLDEKISNKDVINILIRDPNLFDAALKIHEADGIDQIEKSFSLNAAKLSDNEAINILASLFNLFLLETGKNDDTFRKGTYLFLDEMDLLKEVNMADNVAVNGLIRSLYDLIPSSFCLILGMTASNAELPGLIQDYVETRVTKVIPINHMDVKDTLNFTKDLMNLYRENENDKKKMDFFPFEKDSVQAILDTTEVTPRKIAQRMKKALAEVRRSGYDPSKSGAVKLKYLEQKDILTQLGTESDL